MEIHKKHPAISIFLFPLLLLVEPVAPQRHAISAKNEIPPISMINDNSSNSSTSFERGLQLTANTGNLPNLDFYFGFYDGTNPVAPTDAQVEAFMCQFDLFLYDTVLPTMGNDCLVIRSEELSFRYVADGVGNSDTFGDRPLMMTFWIDGFTTDDSPFDQQQAVLNAFVDNNFDASSFIGQYLAPMTDDYFTNTNALGYIPRAVPVLSGSIVTPTCPNAPPLPDCNVTEAPTEEGAPTDEGTPSDEGAPTDEGNSTDEGTPTDEGNQDQGAATRTPTTSSGEPAPATGPPADEGAFSGAPASVTRPPGSIQGEGGPDNNGPNGGDENGTGNGAEDPTGGGRGESPGEGGVPAPFHGEGTADPTVANSYYLGIGEGPVTWWGILVIVLLALLVLLSCFVIWFLLMVFLRGKDEVVREKETSVIQEVDKESIFQDEPDARSAPPSAAFDNEAGSNGSMVPYGGPTKSKKKRKSKKVKLALTN